MKSSPLIPAPVPSRRRGRRYPDGSQDRTDRGPASREPALRLTDAFATVRWARSAFGAGHWQAPASRRLSLPGWPSAAPRRSRDPMHALTRRCAAADQGRPAQQSMCDNAVTSFAARYAVASRRMGPAACVTSLPRQRGHCAAGTRSGAVQPRSPRAVNSRQPGGGSSRSGSGSNRAPCRRHRRLRGDAVVRLPVTTRGGASMFR